MKRKQLAMSMIKSTSYYKIGALTIRTGEWYIDMIPAEPSTNVFGAHSVQSMLSEVGFTSYVSYDAKRDKCFARVITS
jgi:hypothetical protein